MLKAGVHSVPKIAGRKIPILLVTAHDSQELRATVAAIGGMEVFPKPIDPEALSAKMEALLA